MTKTLTRTYDSYHFGSSSPLTDEQLEQLVGLFNAPINSVDSVLGGRSSVAVAHIDGLGSVVIKYYTRGGLLRLLVKRTYVKWGKTRCQTEYELFQKVRNLGVSVPEPIAYASRGSLFYRGWLVTREIKGQQTLAELAFSDLERVCAVMGQVVHHVSTLIKNRILHIDLHPGNVLVDSGNRTYLVDFDKACHCRGNKNRLRRHYLTRWRRSVAKHGLPEAVYDAMSAALESNHEPDRFLDS